MSFEFPNTLGDPEPVKRTMFSGEPGWRMDGLLKARATEARGPANRILPGQPRFHVWWDAPESSCRDVFVGSPFGVALKEN